jgi:hypothetical protein
MRPIFGPHYLTFPQLQSAVNHAARACHMLSRRSLAIQRRRAEEGDAPSLNDVWFYGRSSELELYVHLLIEDWENGLPPQAAAVAIEVFIDEHIHVFMRDRFGSELECCVPTATSAGETVTRSMDGVEKADVDGEVEQNLAMDASSIEDAVALEHPLGALRTECDAVDDPAAKGHDRLVTWVMRGPPRPHG